MKPQTEHVRVAFPLSDVQNVSNEVVHLISKCQFLEASRVLCFSRTVVRVFVFLEMFTLHQGQPDLFLRSGGKKDPAEDRFLAMRPHPFSGPGKNGQAVCDRAAKTSAGCSHAPSQHGSPKRNTLPAIRRRQNRIAHRRGHYLAGTRPGTGADLTERGITPQERRRTSTTQRAMRARQVWLPSTATANAPQSPRTGMVVGRPTPARANALAPPLRLQRSLGPPPMGGSVPVWQQAHHPRI